MRTLQQRGSLQGMGSPLTAGGGLTTPIPISPAQLTPRSWPPSQGTSLSRSAGQVTHQTHGSRGWLIAGVAFLCVAAGGGGYAISQLSRGDAGSREPHVLAPAPRTEPAAAPASGNPPAAPADPPAPAQTPTPPTGDKPAAAAGAPATAPADGKPTAAGDGKPATAPADGKPTPAADGKPATAPGDDRPANRLVDAKHPSAPPPDPGQPAHGKSADGKSSRSADGKSSRSGDGKSSRSDGKSTKPDGKSTKPDGKSTRPDGKSTKLTVDPIFNDRH
jgi:hypothetical protein